MNKPTRTASSKIGRILFGLAFSLGILLSAPIGKFAPTADSGIWETPATALLPKRKYKKQKGKTLHQHGKKKRQQWSKRGKKSHRCTRA